MNSSSTSSCPSFGILYPVVVCMCAHNINYQLCVIESSKKAVFKQVNEVDQLKRSQVPTTNDFYWWIFEISFSQSFRYALWLFKIENFLGFVFMCRKAKEDMFEEYSISEFRTTCIRWKIDVYQKTSFLFNHCTILSFHVKPVCVMIICSRAINYLDFILFMTYAAWCWSHVLLRLEAHYWKLKSYWKSTIVNCKVILGFYIRKYIRSFDLLMLIWSIVCFDWMIPVGWCSFTS